MGCYPLSSFIHDISLDIDISGAPVTVSYPEGVFFAFSGKGSNAYISSYSTYYTIIVGALNTDGTLKWISRFPSSFQAEGDCYSPSLALGNIGDLYISFVTNAAIPGYANAVTYTPSPNSLPPYGTADVVLARINTVPTLSEEQISVAWAIQGAGLNGPSNQTVPCVAVDSLYGWVYIAYQSSGNIVPFVAIGKTNIILACFNVVTHARVWITGSQPSTGQLDLINCEEYNKNPSIVSDNAGSVYLAYEVTAKTPNGAPVSFKQIEVVKFSTVNLGEPLNPFYVGQYQWTLSATDTTLFVSQGVSEGPQLSYWNNVIYLSFLTTGTIVGGTKSASGHDIVMAALSTDRTLKWAVQGVTNSGPQMYYDVYSVRSCCDEMGNPHIAAVVKKVGSRDSVFVWKLNASSGVSLLSYTAPNEQAVYTLYGFALTDGKNAVLPSKSYEFTTVTISALKGMFYLGYITQHPVRPDENRGVPKQYGGISGFKLAMYAENMSAYKYL